MGLRYALRRYFNPTLPKHARAQSSPALHVAGRLIASSDPAVNDRLRHEREQEERNRPPEPPITPPPPSKTPSYTRASVLDLSRDLRMRHTYCIGKSGTGKTTLLKHLLLANFVRGDGCAFIDPHGDAAEELLGLIPDARSADVTYFDPTSSHAPAFNLLALPYPAPKLADDILSAFRLLFGITTATAPRLEHLLRHALLTLLADRVHEPHSLKDLQRLLRNPDYRNGIVERVSTDEDLRDFWQHEFINMPKDATAPILNKLSALLVPTSDLERVLSSTTNALDFPAILDGGGIFIANLAKGKLGDEPSRLLGALLATAIQQAALARADRPQAERRDFYFYVDEFQNYAVQSFATILSEARKYKLALTLANQNLSQIPTELRAATFDCATLVAFQVSADDASRLGREMHTTKQLYREEGWRGTKPIADFLVEARRRLDQILENANAHYQAGMQYAPDQYTAQRNQIWHNIQTRCENFLRALNNEPLPVALLREIANFETFDGYSTLSRVFPKVEFREEHYPSPDDFLKLKPLNAFVRIDSVDNVSPLTVPLAPAPDPRTRNAVLARQVSRASAPSATAHPLKPSESVEELRAKATESRERAESLRLNDAVAAAQKEPWREEVGRVYREADELDKAAKRFEQQANERAAEEKTRPRRQEPKPITTPVTQSPPTSAPASPQSRRDKYSF